MNSAIVCIISIFCLGVVDVMGSEIPAASCSRTDVAAAVSRAADGDTVLLPACPEGVSWNATLTVAKGISLQGQGPGITVLVDDVPKGDNSCGNGAPMLAFVVDQPRSFRLGGLTIRGRAADGFICQPGHVALGGTSRAFRVHHVRFENQQTVAIRTGGALLGVIDHCEFRGPGKHGIIIDHGRWAGHSYGDGSWAAPSNFGTEEFIFVEDNVFSDPTPVGKGAIDVYGGGRVVFRYNRASWIGSHGTESTGRNRGVRAFEIYGNTFTAVQEAQFTAMFIRGGTGLIFGNTFTAPAGTSYNTIAFFDNYRSKDAFSPWAACDGSSQFDQNSGTAFVTGRHNGANGSNVLTDTSQNFTTACGGSCAGNGLSIRNVTRGWGTAIVGVTSTTVTGSNSGYGQNRTWALGDTYQILRADSCADQVGRGQGVLLSGDAPTVSGGTKQGPEPVYLWANTTQGAVAPDVGSASIHVKPNRDFFNNVAKPGYAPYSYPHPLVTGSTPPATPKNVRIVP